MTTANKQCKISTAKEALQFSTAKLDVQMSPVSCYLNFKRAMLHQLIIIPLHFEKQKMYKPPALALSRFNFFAKS